MGMRSIYWRKVLHRKSSLQAGKSRLYSTARGWADSPYTILLTTTCDHSMTDRGHLYWRNGRWQCDNRYDFIAHVKERDFSQIQILLQNTAQKKFYKIHTFYTIVICIKRCLISFRLPYRLSVGSFVRNLKPSPESPLMGGFYFVLFIYELYTHKIYECSRRNTSQEHHREWDRRERTSHEKTGKYDRIDARFSLIRRKWEI